MRGRVPPEAHRGGAVIRIDKDTKEARDKRIFAMWLACRTQQEIADAEGIDQAQVSRLTDSFMQIGNLAESHKAEACHATDFEPPIYNNLEAAGQDPWCKPLPGRCRARSRPPAERRSRSHPPGHPARAGLGETGASQDRCRLLSGHGQAVCQQRQRPSWTSSASP